MGGYGLDDSLQYFEFSFDSLDTIQSPSAAVSTRDWPLFLLNRPLTNVAAMKILEVQIPFTFYVFNSTNNTFILTENTGSPVTVTIPIGNYSSASMNSTLGTIMTAASPNTRTYTVTYSGASSTQPNTGKFTISSSDSSVFTLNFGTSEGNTDPSLFFGFNTGINSSTSGGVLVAPNVASITGPNYLYLNSRKMGTLCNMFLPQGADKLGNGTNGPQLAKIPVNVQPNGIIFWQDPAPEMWFDLENLTNFANIDFYFTLGNTSAQTPLEFNGVSFSLKLGVLINKKSHNSTLGGLAHQERVVLRSIPF